MISFCKKWLRFILFCLGMRILVVAAMPHELKAIKNWIKSAWIKENLDIDYLCCWIWNYEAISSLEHYLTESKVPIFIWNIWICGYWNPKNVKKSDPIQVAAVVNMHTQKEMVVPPFLCIAPLKNCFCGESIVCIKPESRGEIWAFDDEMYFDMESRWIEFISSKDKCPCLILKVPFEFSWDGCLPDKWNFKEISCEVSELLFDLPYDNFLKVILDWIKNHENI